MDLTLSVHHLIYLTREQRYRLHGGEDVEVTGVSVPVWFTEDFSSEPGREIFCKYILKNPKSDLPIQIGREGYFITLPNNNSSPLPNDITNEQYWQMSDDEQEEYSLKKGVQASSKNLLDVQDGGCCSLVYREHNRIKKDGEVTNIVHCVQIEDMEKLLESIEEPTIVGNPLETC